MTFPHRHTILHRTEKCLAALFSLSLSLVPCPAWADEDEPSTAALSASLYDFSHFNAETVLNLFCDALQQGRNYPTDAEFAAVGILPSDVAFIRSHVRRADIISRADRLLPDTYENRELWCNFPMGTKKEENNTGGFPNSTFDTDVFSMWQYTHLFGSWNHCFFQAPGAWVDAAHKNGTDILSGLKFFESWNVGDKDWVSFCTTKNDDGTFRYVRPLINALLFFGSDGINFNWEDEQYENADVVLFHKALYKEAASVGFSNFHVAMYTDNTVLAPMKADAIFGSTAKGKTTDLMLNYADGDFSAEMDGSALMALRLMGTTEGIYGGVHILSMNRAWPMLDISEYMHLCNLCMWGEHGETWFWANTEGDNPVEHQANYQRLLERGFSGGNRNPALRPEPDSKGNNWTTDADGKLPLSTFCGLAEFIPERSAIQGNLPFETFFNLGNGAFYHYKGKHTAGSWANMGNQDIVPTYRWLTLEAGTETVSTDIQPEFTHTDAYMGGSCLRLRGKVSEKGTDIILYKTLLKVNGAATARIALKQSAQGKNPSALSLLIRKQGSSAWQEYPLGAVSGTTWQVKDFSLSGVASGDVIDRIALRVKGTPTDGYDLKIGQFAIHDSGAKATPASPEQLVAEVREETQSSLSLKLAWQLSATQSERQAWNMTFNDEASVHHFEILTKTGAEGRVREVMRTTQWAALVSNLRFSEGDGDIYIGVRSVGTDLCTYSPVSWLRVERSTDPGLPEHVSADTLTFEGLDAGTPDEPDCLSGTTEGIGNAPHETTAPLTLSDGMLHLTAADALWIYDSAGRLLQFSAQPAQVVSLRHLKGTAVVVKVLHEGIIRSRKFVVD